MTPAGSAPSYIIEESSAWGLQPRVQQGGQTIGVACQ